MKLVSALVGFSMLLSPSMGAKVSGVTVGDAPASTTTTANSATAPAPAATPANTIVDIAVGSADHKTLVKAVTAAGLVEALSGDGPLTVFAPVDSAFSGLDVARLLEPQWNMHLKDLLSYHVLAGQVMSTDLEVGLEADMLNGESIEVTSLSPPMVNEANIVAADVAADNGVVHVVDSVLLPTSATSTIVDLAVASPEFSTLVDLITTAGLAQRLSIGALTAFAPTDAAFAKLPAGTLETLKAPENRGTLRDILTYHVAGMNVVTSDRLEEGMYVKMLNGKTAPVSLGSGAMIGNAKVVTADILAKNGVIHAIDTVLIPPETTIAETAVASPDHTILVQALTAAGLVDMFSGPGNFTVFAPVDTSFGALPPGTLERLLEDEYKPHLIDLLSYHVAASPILSKDLSAGLTAEMLNGETITVTSMNPPTINDAFVNTPDIMTGNGVIHSMGGVLLPKSATHSIVDLAAADPNFSTLVELVTSAGLAETLASGGPFTVFAPTNDAFAQIPAETLSALTPEEVVDILTYHVYDGVVTSDKLSETTFTMLNGAIASVSLAQSRSAMIGSSNIVTADLLANNGVVHVIDAVLMPPFVDASSGSGSGMGSVVTAQEAPAGGATLCIDAATGGPCPPAAPANAMGDEDEDDEDDEDDKDEEEDEDDEEDEEEDMAMGGDW